MVFRVAAGNLEFLLRYDWDLRDPLVLPQEIQDSNVSCQGPLRILVQSVPGPRSSSGVEAGNSGFLSITYMDLGVPMEFQQGSQASSGVETCKSGFLSTCKGSFRIPVVLT